MNILQQQQKQWNLLIILFILIIAFGYCIQSLRVANLKADTVQNITNFAQQIKAIDRKIVDLSIPSDLFEHEEFRKIHKNPEDYYPIVFKALKSSEYTDQQKMIIGHSMHGSDLDQFLSLAKYSLQLLESGEISKIVFDRMIFPTYEWNSTIIKNYDKEEVSIFLQQLMSSESISDYLKNLIREDIVTGKAKAFVIEVYP